MKRNALFFLMIVLMINLSYAQSNDRSITGDVTTINLNSYSEDQLEDFIINNYAYSRILSDLEVTKKYQNEKELEFRRFVYFKIDDFYQQIFSHSAGETNAEIADTYADFIAATKQAIQANSFEEESIFPPIENPSYSYRNACINMDFAGRSKRMDAEKW